MMIWGMDVLEDRKIGEIEGPNTRQSDLDLPDVAVAVRVDRELLHQQVVLKW